MRQFCILFVAMLATAAAPAPKQRAQHAPRQCFWASEVSGFSDAGPDRALLRIGARETWELRLSPGCPHIDWAMRIGIRAHGGERICTGRPAELLIPDAGGSELRRCLVSSVRKLPQAKTR